LHTFPFISYSVLRSLPGTNNNQTSSDFLCMDVGSECTDIICVGQDPYIRTISFPCGENSIIHSIRKSLAVSPEIAASTLRLALLHRMDESVNVGIQKAIGMLEKEWAIYFEDALTSLDPLLQ